MRERKDIILSSKKTYLAMRERKDIILEKRGRTSSWRREEGHHLG